MITPAPSTELRQTVYVVDDDASTREVLSWLMKRHNLACETFAEPRAFLEACKPGHAGCVVLDLDMPGMSGLELQAALTGRGIRMPVIFLSGRADVPRAVAAVKGGALDFIEKPFDYKRILAQVQECLARDRAARSARAGRQAIEERFATLTQREREVMDRVVAGDMNREIAMALEISIKTVEAHRARIMEKLGVDSVAGLVQASLEAKPR